MRKRGAGHIEMIFSFILFISVVVFALFFFKPAQGPDVTDSTLPFVFREITENISVRMDSFSVKVNSANGDVVGLLFEGVSTNMVPRVERSEQGGDEVVLNSAKILGGVAFDYEYLGMPSFYVIQFSEDFPEPTGTTGTNPATEIDHELASTSSRKLISEKRFRALIEDYETNYDGLKGSLAVPQNMDFSVSLVVGNDVWRVERDIPQGLEIYSNNKRLEVVREDGSLAFGDLALTIW